MKYRLLDYYKENGIQSFDLNHILKARGLDEKKIKTLMTLTDDVLLDPFDMLNMREGIELLMKHVLKGNKIAILNDEDMDGFTSASVIYLFLQENFPDVTLKHIINKDKCHGVDLKHFEKYDPDYDYDLLIIPDASAGQKEVDFLKSKDVDILILDHHITTEPSEGAITVNPNQVDCDYQNKDLSGVGVVYKLLVALSTIYDTTDPDKYLDLVAVGMIADVMSLKSPETRHLINKGLDIMQERRDKIAETEGEYFPEEGNKLLNAFLHKKWSYDLKKLTHKTVAFKIAPLVNGCIRSGTFEEKDAMFRAFLGSEEKSLYQPRRKSKNDPKPDPIELPLYMDMVRLLTNVKSRQDREVKKVLKVLEERIEERDLLRGKVLIVDATGLVENKSLTGLVAQKICSKYMRPTIVLKQRDDDRYGGSCRNFNMSPVESFKELIDSTGLATGAGHDNACGFNCDIENVVEAWNIMNDELKDTDLTQIHKVDAIIPFRKLNSKKVMEIGELMPLWGADVKAPKIAVTGVSVPVADIERIGDKGTIIRFKKGDHSFYKFYANEEMANDMRMREKSGFGNKSPKHVVFDLVVEFEINEYQGKNYPQIVILDYNVKAKEEVLF